MPVSEGEGSGLIGLAVARERVFCSFSVAKETVLIVICFQETRSWGRYELEVANCHMVRGSGSTRSSGKRQASSKQPSKRQLETTTLSSSEPGDGQQSGFELKTSLSDAGSLTPGLRTLREGIRMTHRGVKNTELCETAAGDFMRCL
ncbi:hypothetical protein Bbelb_154900 [Branchiostoma belcheri]|nr:hypothetical protein Bbelb_154900 [Branchiostoma belcheri]